LQFSISEIRTYQRCRRKRQYYSSNVNNLEPIITKPHFIVGTLIHEVFSQWIKTPNLDPNTLYTVYSHDAVKKYAEEYEQHLNMRPSTSELEPVLEAVDMGKCMIENYQSYYKTPIPTEYSVYDTEQEVTINIPNTDHQFLMKIDGLLSNNGNLYVLEHKTYSQKPNAIALVMDAQFTAYVWGCNQLGIGRVSGLYYNGLWKRSAPPRGRIFDELFYRQVLRRSRLQLSEFESELVELVNEMATTTSIVKTVPWNGCIDCDYSKLCQAHTNHEDVDYIKSTFYRQKSTREVDDT
jgi:CRISPR/Cas system-associated exonuclease Cas4 (RecB family)